MRSLKFTDVFKGETLTLVQINKPTARKLFIRNEARILVQSSKLHPLGVWSEAVELNPDWSFGPQVDAFQRYNCNNKTGKYVSFYKVVER